MAKGKRQGPRRGEYCGRPSRQSRLPAGNKRLKPSADGPCGSPHRRPPAVLPPAALSFRSALAIHKPSSSGRHPPPGGGRMLVHSPFSESLSTITRQFFPSAGISEEPCFPGFCPNRIRPASGARNSPPCEHGFARTETPSFARCGWPVGAALRAARRGASCRTARPEVGPGGSARQEIARFRSATPSDNRAVGRADCAKWILREGGKPQKAPPAP